LEFSDLAGGCAGGKYQLPVRGGRRAPICAGVTALEASIAGPLRNIPSPA